MGAMESSGRNERGIEVADRAAVAALYVCAALLGAGVSWAWIAVALAVAAALARGPIAPTAITLPFCLFGLAVGLGAVASGPGASGLGSEQAWAMIRPAIAIPLVGVMGRGRAFWLGATFVAAATLRGGVGLLPVASPAQPFLAAAGLVGLAAAWATGAVGKRGRGPALAAAAILAAALWFAAPPGGWLALAVAFSGMAVIGRRPLPFLPFAGVAVAATILLLPDATPGDDKGFAWSQALELLSRDPAGVGAGNFGSLTRDAFAARGLSGWSHPHNGLLAVWAENGPLGLVAATWIFAALLAGLRRGWKAFSPVDPETPRAGAAVLGAAGLAGLFLAWSLGDNPLADPGIGLALGFAMGLGLAAAGGAGGPSPVELGAGVPPLPRKAAGGASLAIAGAALGGIAAPGPASPGIRLAAASLLAVLAIVHLPWIRGALPLALRGLVVYCGAVFLASRPFAIPLAPGSSQWWQSPSALAALCGLGAAVAGAGHAIRRPGSIGPAPVAGAIASLVVILFVTLLNEGGLSAIAPGFDPAVPYNFAVASCLASFLFVAWSGPLGFGRAELDPRVRRLAGLPTAAVACGLLATLIRMTT